MNIEVFAENLISDPYERLFLEPGQKQQYIRNYIDLLDGRIRIYV